MRGIYNARFTDMKTEAQLKPRGRSEPCCLRPQSPDSALLPLFSYDGVNRSGLHEDKVTLGAGSEWSISPQHHSLCAKNCSAGSKIELLTWSGSGVPGGYCSSASRRWGPVWRLGLTRAADMKKIWEAGLRQASGDFLSTCVDGNNRKSRRPPWVGLPLSVHSQGRTDTPRKGQGSREAFAKHLLYAWPYVRA